MVVESPGFHVLSLKEAMSLSAKRIRLASGSRCLDELLGGGYREGQITEIFGASNTGKTQIAMQATVMAAGRGLMSVYVDTESTFRPERIARMAEKRGLDPTAVLERIYCIEARDATEQASSVARMRQNERVRSAKLHVVDTLTKNFSLDFPGSKAVGKRQSALASYLNSVSRDAFLSGRIVVLTNRVASVARGRQEAEVDIGGITLERFVGVSIHLRRQGESIAATRVQPQHGPTVDCRITENGFE